MFHAMNTSYIIKNNRSNRGNIGLLLNCWNIEKFIAHHLHFCAIFAANYMPSVEEFTKTTKININFHAKKKLLPNNTTLTHSFRQHPSQGTT